MAERLKSQVEAEKRREARFDQVLIRLRKEEAALIDAIRGDESRAGWIKAKAMAAAKRRGK